MNREALRASLRVHEDESLIPYRCSEGYLTIGVGCNLDKGITAKQSAALLECDIDTAVEELDRGFKGWRNHNEARQNVLAEMMFNLGAKRLAGFTHMWDALARKDYMQAAAEMRDSKWRRQVGQRAETLARIMENG